jgi:hypothetical protein
VCCLSLWLKVRLRTKELANRCGVMLLALQNESARQQLRLGSHEAELNRIDTALVCAVKGGGRLPSSPKIFGALSDASFVCAEMLDAYADRPIPLHLHIGLSRLHCAITNLEASLKTYAVLSLAKRA